MKKIIIAASTLLLAAACKKQDSPVPPGASIAIFAVNNDGTGYHLIGGKVLPFLSGNAEGDTIPLKSTFVAGGDINSFTLTYIPTGDTVFNGVIMWVGTGYIRYPAFDSPAVFFKTATQVPVPDTNAIQLIHKTSYDASVYPADINAVWAQLSGRYIVSEYMRRHARVALMQYSDIVAGQIPAGTGVPGRWSWIWIFYLNNQ